MSLSYEERVPKYLVFLNICAAFQNVPKENLETLHDCGMLNTLV